MPLSFVPISSNPISAAKEVAVGTITAKRRPRGVYANIQVDDGDLTEAQFLELMNKEIPEGYSDFEPFITGNYHYRYALVKAVIQSEMVGVSPSIKKMALTVDVPDINDNGVNETVSALGTDIAFKKTFTVPPTVNVTVVSSVTACYPRLSRLTEKYFTVELVDVSGSLVSGRVNWWAEGY